jgi:hypothetical protein
LDLQTPVLERPNSPGVQRLHEVRYSGLQKEPEVELGVILDRNQGLYHLNRVQVGSVEALERLRKRRVSGLDPGQAYVFNMTTAVAEAWTLEDVPALLTADNSFVTGEVYRTRNGAAHTTGADVRRRQANPFYNAAVQRLGVERTSASGFVSYCKASCRVLGAREVELMHLKRSLARFSRFRDNQRGLAWLAAQIVDPSMPREERPIIFYGDGATRSMPGHASTPNKKLLRILAQYCIVIVVPEGWTSQTCPSCRRRTENGGNRTRKCTTTPEAEPHCYLPVNAVGERVLDRDLIGGINIGLRAVYRLRGTPLPHKPLDVQ